MNKKITDRWWVPVLIAFLIFICLRVVCFNLDVIFNKVKTTNKTGYYTEITQYTDIDYILDPCSKEYKVKTYVWIKDGNDFIDICYSEYADCLRESQVDSAKKAEYALAVVAQKKVEECFGFKPKEE